MKNIFSSTVIFLALIFHVDSKANSTRGNFDFAEVVTNLNLKNCNASKSGASVLAGGKNFLKKME